jgi:hypothetical protein
MQTPEFKLQSYQKKQNKRKKYSSIHTWHIGWARPALVFICLLLYVCFFLILISVCFYVHHFELFSVCLFASYVFVKYTLNVCANVFLNSVN